MFFALCTLAPSIAIRASTAIKQVSKLAESRICKDLLLCLLSNSFLMLQLSSLCSSALLRLLMHRLL